ncbi:MAG TPA: hypothetical protein VG308_01490 [Stellaceae bacterium]|nr:hypothetical protein [Stellaceae bacterium]
MTGRFWALGLVLLLAACGGENGMRCEYSAGNLDAIKTQVAGLKAGGTTAAEIVKSLGKPSADSPTPDGGKTYEYEFPQPLTPDSSPACPAKSQKATFIFNARDVLQSMQINF